MFEKLLKTGFAEYIRKTGGPVLVHRMAGTDAEAAFETVGLRTRSDFVVTPNLDAFLFPEPLELESGTILQEKGSDELWRVDRIDDSIEEETFLYRMAIVTPTTGVGTAESDAAPAAGKSDAAGWVLWRQDDNGNRAPMHGFGDRAEAERAMRAYEVLGHKQTYWVEPAD